MAAIQHMEITGNTVPLFGSEYRIKESKFNIAFTESDISTRTLIAGKKNSQSKEIKRFCLNLFFCPFKKEQILIEENRFVDREVIIDQPFRTRPNMLIAVPNSSDKPNLILQERVPRKIDAYIALDVNDSDVLFVFQEESRIILPYLHKSPNEGDVIFCRTLHVSGNKKIQEILSNLPKLYKENGLENDNPRECNWQRDERNNEQVMVSKKTEDGRKVYWKSNHNSSELVITYNRRHAVKGCI